MVELVLAVIGVVAVVLLARRIFKKEDVAAEPTGGDVYVPPDFTPPVQADEPVVAPPVVEEAPKKVKKAVAKKTAPKKRGRPAKKTKK